MPEKVNTGNFMVADTARAANVSSFSEIETFLMKRFLSFKRIELHQQWFIVVPVTKRSKQTNRELFMRKRRIMKE